MSSDPDELPWDEYAGPRKYGAIDSNEDNEQDFRNLKINLENKQQEIYVENSKAIKMGNSEKDEENLGELRKSNASANKDGSSKEMLIDRAERCCN